MFDMILKAFQFCFSLMSDSNITVAGFTVLGICILNFVCYTVIRFFVTPLLGEGIGWSKINFGALRGDSVSDSPKRKGEK